MIRKIITERKDWTSNENDVFLSSVSPELAKKMLATVIDCDRKERVSHTEELAKAMRENRYSSKVKGSGVAFNPNGNLIDGKHTLKAVIMSGKTVDMKVEVGSLHVEYVDSGKSRTMKERIVYYGFDEKDADDLVPAIKNIFHLRNKKPLSNTAVKDEYSVDRFIDFLEQHIVELKVCLDIYNTRIKKEIFFRYLNRLEKCVIIAYLYHLIYEKGYNKDKVTNFFSGIKNTKNSENPVIEKCRIDFLKNSTAPKAKTYSPMEVHNFVVEYFTDYIKDLPTAKKHNKKVKFLEFAPSISIK